MPKGLDIIVLLLISVASFYAARFLSKISRIPAPIFYLALGILLGKSGINVFNASNFPLLGIYSSIALWTLFIGAGFSLDLKTLGKTGKNAIKLSVIPAYLELAVMGIAVYFIINNLGMGWHITIYEAYVISILYSCASPSNVIPITTEHAINGRVGNNNSAQNVTIASVLDNFTNTPFFYVIVSMVVGSQLGFGDTPVKVAITSTIYMVLSVVFAFLLGYVATLLFNPIGKKVKEGKLNIKIYAVIYMAFFVIVMFSFMKISFIKSGLGVFAILIATIFSSGIKFFEKNNQADKVKMQVNKIFAIFCMPIIFISAGGKIDLQQISSLRTILICLLIMVLAIVAKSIGTVLSMRDPKFTKDDIKYTIAAFIPRGIPLVSFGVVLTPMLVGTDSNLIVVMLTIAAVSTLVSFPLGITLMTKGGEKWLAAKKD